MPGENHRPVASHLQTLLHNVVSSTPHLRGARITTSVVIGTDCIGSCKYNYHTVMEIKYGTEVDMNNKEYIMIPSGHDNLVPLSVNNDS